MPGWEMCLILALNIFKMKKFILLILIIGIVSCKGSKNSATSNIDLFAVENLAVMNSEDIGKNYTDTNIQEDIGMFEEGTEERPYTTLYSGTPDEIQITWANPQRSKIYDIRFTGDGRWKSQTGIKVGTSYEELNQINGKKVSFYGFGWDYSGAVMWNDGKLEDSKIFVFLSPNNSAEGNKFYGDHIIQATPEEIAALNLRVSTILYKL